MKKAMILLALLATTQATAGGWADGPGSWKNSPHNWQNRSSSYHNLPYNSRNANRGWNNETAIFDSQGNKAGYFVPKPSGGVNYFSSDGDWMGFSPGPR